MIPEHWLKKKTTIEEAEQMRFIDFVTAFREDQVIDKTEWWKEPYLPSRLDWQRFKARITPTTELWFFHGMLMGFALIENNVVVDTFTIM